MVKHIKILILPLVVLSLVFVSCQKELDIDLDDPPDLPDEVKDSTLLIKSIAYVYNGGTDSIVEYYHYDTANRKITLNWTDSETDPQDPDYQSIYSNSKAVLTYNNKGLLIHGDYEYPVSYNGWEYAVKSIDINYDNDNIVSQIDVRYLGGSTASTPFTKTILADGNYRLQWEESDPDDPIGWIITRTAEFTAEHKAILNSQALVESIDNIDYNILWKDTLIYDASGNVVRVSTYYKDERYNTDQNFISEEYSGRWTKGDQLYNQRKLILNGITDIPFNDESELISFYTGVLSFQMGYETAQYSKFPIKSARLQSYDGTYEDVVSNVEFDSKDRLLKCSTFWLDAEVVRGEYRITYFK